MREIKFRGYNNETKQWLYGYLCKDITPDELLIERDMDVIGHKVDKDSIGQYTGFKDKNGIEIYEGDILKVNGNYEIYVEWFDGSWIVKDDFDVIEDARRDLLIDYKNYELEVVGNIYERNKQNGI